MSFVQEKTFSEAKYLVLQRLRQDLKKMPESERDKPRYVLADPVTGERKVLSQNALIVEVERETNLGRDYVYTVVGQLNIVITD